MTNKESVYAKDRAALRKWLTQNHTQPSGVWLKYDKAKDGKRSLSYDEIVEELLCFGWIDSVTKTIDDKYAAIYISPRRAKSPWSKSNKQRIIKLLEQNLITPAGMSVIGQAKKDGSWSIYDAVENLEIPADLEKSLKQNKIAEKNFNAFSNSNKKQIIWHIISAKQVETRKSRIEKIVSEAAKNNNPLEYRKNKK